MAPVSSADLSVIQEEDQVVFRRDGACRIYQIKRNRQVYFEKAAFKVDDLIGQPYGSTFEIDKGKLVRFEPDRIVQLKETISSAPGADNRDLIDTESNQRMSTGDIMKMKDDGFTGEKIIEELIENSETFRKKTEFSQAKYLKKKKKKHILVFTVLRPTPRLVMEIFSKEPGKICNLRNDSLSQLLSYSNVMCGSKVGVIETCQGLVLACVLQRMGGQGKLIQLVPNETNTVCRQVMDYFSFPKEHMDNLYTFPLDKLSALNDGVVQNKRNSSDLGLEKIDARLPETCDLVVEDSPAEMEGISRTESDMKCIQEHIPSGAPAAAVNTMTSGATDTTDTTATSGAPAATDTTVTSGTIDGTDTTMTSGTIDATESNGSKEDSIDAETEPFAAENSSRDAMGQRKRPLSQDQHAKKQLKITRQKEAGDIMLNKQLDSLILACKYNPFPLLIKLLEFMPPSRPVAVYCQYFEPLVECYTHIKKNGLGLQLKMSETWLREYQVLDQRTHPMMNMSGSGGYLLTFMTIQAETAPASSS